MRRLRSLAGEHQGKLLSFFRNAGAPPLEKWHDSVRNVLTIDIGYYDNWLKLPSR